MRGSRRVTERTSLTRPTDTSDYVEFASLLRTRRSRIKHFQCCVCATLIAVFTMALIVTISYSMNHDTIDNPPDLPPQELSSASENLTGPLRLGFAPGSGSYTLFGNPASIPNSRIVFVGKKATDSPTASLTDNEFKEGLRAGQLAIDERLLADAAALASPVQSPSPESRHRYAVSTCASVGALALAAVGEIAATRQIENSRALLSQPSSIGSFFDGGWMLNDTCKEFRLLNCTLGKYRTFDGTCNRPLQRGASMTPFRRVLPASYADGIETPRKSVTGKDLPSAREISLRVHKPAASSNPAFTVMLAVYGQFLDHDITATAISQGTNGSSISCCPPAVGHPECFPVRVATGDPVFDAAGRTCMEFVRSAPAPQCMLGPRQQLNQVTAFIDGSAIYGSDIGTANSLREFAGGRLRMQLTPDNRTLLPPSTNPNDGCNRETERSRGRYCFAAGDARANENLHLTTMHLLWARQHNRIAEELTKINPIWDDETLYQETRRIVGAQLQHITYQEFVPIVLGEQEANSRELRPLKTGYRKWTESPDDESEDPTIANSFASAAFRFAHTLLPGLMKVTDNEKGTSSYVELHRMLFNPYSLYAEGGVKSSVTSATSNVIQRTSPHVTSQLTNHLFEDPIGNQTVPCGLDLVSLNIQRGRDHGLPGYTEWREYCGLGKTEDFSDLEGYLDPQVLEEISIIYESVRDVDLYTGALSELPKPGGLVGPTFACLIADQFARLQRGDRFWYEVPDRPHSFTEAQLRELRKTSLARLICDCSDGVTQIQAQAMRSIGPENTMISCEDIPGPSFEAWRNDRLVPPTLMSSPMPINWMELKNNINDTIRDIVSFINSTRASVTPSTTDWLEFRNYVNDTFSDLRDQLVDLHPRKAIDAPPTNETSITEDTFILRATPAASVYQDWISFKNSLVKSLNDSIGTIGSGSASAGKWIAFKQSVINQFADLKNQISSVKSDFPPKLLFEKYKNEQAAASVGNRTMDTRSSEEPNAPLPAIFDWKNFKDNIAQSLDDVIMNIGDNMPPPGDPAWAAFGNDVRDRFAAFKDEVSSQRTTAQPTELAIGRKEFNVDWMAYKADVVETVNNAVKRIQDEMPPPGDPAWATYRDEIVKSFSAFRNAPPLVEYATLPSISGIPSERGRLASAVPTKLTSNELTNLTNDWLDFRTKMNDSLTRVIQDIQSKKATTIDPVGWAAFKDSAKNDFAKLKDEIVNTKIEWIREINKPKSKETGTTPVLGGSKKSGPGDYSKFDYSVFMKPAIPASEWIAFKQEINDTVMSILNAANSTDQVDLNEIQEMFDKSFVDLKNEIASLRQLAARNASAEDLKFSSNSLDQWNKTAADWIKFRTNLNSTVNALVEGLRNESEASIGNVMRILFRTKDRLSDLEPPSSPVGASAADWLRYVSGINKTVTDALKSAGDSKRVTLMMKAGISVPSSSDRSQFFTNWIVLPCIVSWFHLLVPKIKSDLEIPSAR